MADFALSLLQSNLPAGAVVEDAANNDVTISLKALTGDPTVDLNSTIIGEAIHKLLLGCQTAQTTYNQTADPAMNAFPSVAPGTARLAADGNYYSTFNHSVAIRVPLNTDSASGSVVA